jgi:Fe-S-cluster containining protein
MMDQKIIPIAVIRERQNDPETDKGAEERGAIVRDRMNKVRHKVEALWSRAYYEASLPIVFRLIRASTEYLEKAMQGVAPCKDKCSHCCSMPVMLSQAEADLIAKETGHKLNKDVTYSTTAKMEHDRTPCPFLKNDTCSIYHSRPIACRVHYVLDKDNLLCRRYDGVDDITAPHWNNMPFMQALIQALPREQLYMHADIRDYFGPKK